jgi:hypothetical protein
MSYTLRVLFSGLCVFVPDRPFDDFEQPPTEVKMLLQNLLQPQSLTNAVDGDVLDPHYPMLEFDLSDLHPQSPRKPDLSRQDLGKGACLLIGEELSLDLNLSERKGLRCPGRDRQPDANQETATSRDEDSLYWLARIDKASPDTFIDPEVLNEKLSLDGEPTILARLSLQEGFLRVTQRSDKVCEFHPPDPVNPYRQQIATELALDIQGVEGPVVIVGRRPDGTERRLALTPVKSPGLVEIRVQNREIDGLLGVPSDLMLARELADYEVFYELITPTTLVAGQPLQRRFPKQPVPPPPPNGGGPSLKNPSLCPPTGMFLKPAA